VAQQVEAIKNLKIDKVTVWDTMGGGKDQPTTAKFLAGLLQSLPPLQNLFEMAGMTLPPSLNVKPPAPPETEAPEQKKA
jgi:flotillin